MMMMQGLLAAAVALSPASSLPAKWPVAGITLTAGRYCPNVTFGSRAGLWALDHLASTGATHVALVATSYQHSINTTDIFPLFQPSSQYPPQYYVYTTPTDADLTAAIRRAHALGLKVMLKPHVDPLTDNAPLGHTWRGDIGKFFDNALWDAWFASYWRMFSRYARLAEAEGVEILSMNCELITANNQSMRWRELVRRTRGVFSGRLTTAPNGHGHENWVDWWDALDVIGVDLYDHINGTTLEEMVASWRPYLDHLYAMSRANGGLPVMLTEIGYCSGGGGGCNRQRDATVRSLAHQATHYEALFQAVARFENNASNFFQGAFWWNWDTDPAVGVGGHDACLNPAWKPAEDVLRKYYRAPGPRPTLPEDFRRQQCVCTF